MWYDDTLVLRLQVDAHVGHRVLVGHRGVQHGGQEAGSLVERGVEEDVGHAALGAQLPVRVGRRTPPSTASTRLVATPGRAGCSLRPRAATSAAMSCSATATRWPARSARPPMPMTRVHAGSASRSAAASAPSAASKRRQVGAVHDQQFVAHAQPGEPVGEVDQVVELGGGDEQGLLGVGEELHAHRRPGHDAQSPLRAGEQPEEVGLSGAFRVQ